MTYIIYLDDILIFSKNPKDYEKYIRKVLKRLRKAKLYINLDKCDFYQDTVGYFRFVVGLDGVKMEEERVTTIIYWPTLVLVKDI